MKNAKFWFVSPQTKLNSFFVAQVMTSFLILNLFVAVIMDNFDYLTR